MWPWPWLLHLLDDLLEVVGHGRQRLPAKLHPPVGTPRDHRVEGGVGGILLGEVVAEVTAAALLALDGGAGHRLRDREQAVQVDGGVPPGIVLAVARDADLI